MTLRVDISIIPHGVEENRYQIYRLDISNTGMIKNLGFGHEICSYSVKKYRWNNEATRNLLNLPEWELEDTIDIEDHDRRDGAIELVRKATELIAE